MTPRIMRCFSSSGSRARGRVAAEAIDAGDLKAIAPYLKVLDGLDRYHKAGAAKPVYNAAAPGEALRQDEPRRRPPGGQGSQGGRARRPRPDRRRSRASSADRRGMRRNSQGDPNNRRRQLHGLILRSDAQRRVSKDGPAFAASLAPLERPSRRRASRGSSGRGRLGSYDESPQFRRKPLKNNDS